MIQIVVFVALAALALHLLLLFAVPLVRCKRFGWGPATLWAIGSLLLFPLGVVAVQWKRLEGPSWISWGLRVAVGLAVLGCFISLGNSGWNRSLTMISLKTKLIDLMCTEPVANEGSRLTAGKEFLELREFGNAPYAVAGWMAVCGMFLYRNPVEKALILVSIGFVSSTLLDALVLAQYFEPPTEGAAFDTRLQMLHDWRGMINMWLPLVLTYWLTMAWAIFDSRATPQSEVAEAAPDA